MSFRGIGGLRWTAGVDLASFNFAAQLADAALEVGRRR